MMSRHNRIHDEFCRCDRCKPGRPPTFDLYDALDQPVYPIHPATRLALDRASLGGLGMVAVLALCLSWAGLA